MEIWEEGKNMAEKCAEVTGIKAHSRVLDRFARHRLQLESVLQELLNMVLFST